ncbi:alpha/beta fold hydrolase [Nocardia sp. NPDC051030]|uniref:lipase family protein n=1 Tax=Nocardia sp. NPDC051030 TaxID=3155162 RepID=UPI0034388A01
MSTEETAAYLSQGKFDTPVRNGVDAYRVVYRTIAPDGSPTTASGLVVLPRTDSPRLRVVTYEHGTLVLKTDAPSVNSRTRPDQARTIMFAATGYAALAPDYLGLGEGPGTHPYTHAPSEVSASLDLLRAANTFAAQQHREFDPGILVTGFSQGGHAATAFAKALQGGDAPGFGLADLAPISGPYDIQNVETPAGLDGRVSGRIAVVYFAYWITSMNRIYHLYDNPADAFQQPYAAQVEQLFDGTHNEVAIALALPDTPQKLLTPQFIQLAVNPSGVVLKSITDSDGTCAWTPRIPVHLFAATGDHNVPYANAEHCLQALHSDKATLTDLGDIDHGASVQVALPQILDLFQQEVPAT